jgi:hypothetical protein
LALEEKKPADQGERRRPRDIWDCFVVGLPPFDKWLVLKKWRRRMKLAAAKLAAAKLVVFLSGKFS